MLFHLSVTTKPDEGSDTTANIPILQMRTWGAPRFSNLLTEAQFTKHRSRDPNLGSLTSETCSQSDARKEGRKGGAKTLADGGQDTTATSEVEAETVAVSTQGKRGHDQGRVGRILS